MDDKGLGWKGAGATALISICFVTNNQILICIIMFHPVMCLSSVALYTLYGIVYMFIIFLYENLKYYRTTSDHITGQFWYTIFFTNYKRIYKFGKRSNFNQFYFPRLTFAAKIISAQLLQTRKRIYLSWKSWVFLH